MFLLYDVLFLFFEDYLTNKKKRSTEENGTNKYKQHFSLSIDFSYTIRNFHIEGKKGKINFGAGVGRKDFI